MPSPVAPGVHPVPPLSAGTGTGNFICSPSISPRSPFSEAGAAGNVHQEPQSHFPCGVTTPFGRGGQSRVLAEPAVPGGGSSGQSRAGCALSPSLARAAEASAAGALREREQPMDSGRARDLPGKSRLPDSTTSNTSRWFLWVSQTYKQRGKGAGKVQQRTIKHIIFKAVRSLPKILNNSSPANCKYVLSACS